MHTRHSCWEVAEAVLGVSRRVLMFGKPGTGKTYQAATSSVNKDQKVYQITMTDETPAAELRGHYIVKGQEWVWSDGPAIRAWREGARLVINEIDRASEDALSFLYVIMDDPIFAETTLPTGEIVRPAENFQVVATMNGVPSDLPAALQDRFPVDIEITDLNPEAVNSLPEDLREAAINTTLAKSKERGISIRAWAEFANLRERFRETHEDDEQADFLAAEAIFGSNAERALLALDISNEADVAFDMQNINIEIYQNSVMLDYLQKLSKNKTNSPEHITKDINQNIAYLNKQTTELFVKRAQEVNGKVVLTLKDGYTVTLSTFEKTKV